MRAPRLIMAATDKPYRDQRFLDMDRLSGELAKAQSEKDKYTTELRAKQDELIAQEKPLNEALLKLKNLNDKFDAQVRLAMKTQWGLAQRVRAFPILEAFASPYKIQQITNDNVPIDYNFKYVTRFDRCTTCHQGIEDPAFTRE